MELRPKGRAPLDPARQARGHPPLQPLQRVLLAVPRRVDDVLVRDLVARGDDARGGAAHQARARLHEARRCSRAMRVLDVGCGWGAFAIHAAREHGVHVTGITLSRAAGAAGARARGGGRASADRVDIRVMDYREIAGETFDAIASIGMVEHVGSVNIDAYMAKLASLLKPGGRLLNHGIARLRVGDAEAGPFSERYVFPDAAPLHLSRIQTRGRARRAAHPPRRGLPGRLRAHAARVAAPLRGQPRPRAASSAATSACASGGSTCASRARASRAASCPSTRSAPSSRRQLSHLLTYTVRAASGCP